MRPVREFKEIQFIFVSLLLVAAFWPILVSIYGSWFDDNAYMEHGILVVPCAAFMAWSLRDRLRQVPHKPSLWGLTLIVWGAAQATLGMAAHWVWVSRIAFAISLAGSIAAIYGLRMVRELSYPLCTLLLMIAPPSFVYEQLTLSLQLLASRLGEVFLEMLGYSVLREGNILEVVGAKLSIEEACSGLRSLISILFMCTLYNFFIKSRRIRIIILLLAVPIAILCNAGRIVATGIVSQYDPAWVHGPKHAALGYASVAVAGIACVSLHSMIRFVQRTLRRRHAL